MRSIRLAVMVAMIGGGAVATQACGSSNPEAKSPSAEASSSAGKKLDCAFIRNAENCWKTFTAKVSACLGGRPSGPGKLDAEGGLCTLPDDEMVKFDQNCDPDGKCEITDLAIGKAGKKCLEFHSAMTKPASDMGRGEGSFSFVSAGGTIAFKFDEKEKSITCPDFTTYTGSGDWKKDLAECDNEAGYEAIPSFSFVKSPTVMDGKKKKKAGSVTFEVSSMDVVFECQKP